MKILYVANIRIPTHKAHGVQIMKTCEALAQAGCEVELIVPSRKNPIREDAFSYYKVAKAFRLTTLSVPDTVSWGFAGFLFESIFFAISVRRYIRQNQFDVVYGRDEIPLAILSLLGVRNVAWESHTGAWNIFARYLARHVRRLIVISDGLRAFYEAHGIPRARMLVAHDAVDLADFAIHEDKAAARARLNLPADKSIALYVGKLDSGKGSETLGKASEFLPYDIRLVAIGGEPAEIASLKQRYPKLILLGQRPYAELARNLAAADVVVLPNSGKTDVWARFTSPLKLFAYMASGVPIVASDVPALREVLDETSAFWFKSDNERSCADTIKYALSHMYEGGEKAVRARRAVEAYTWDARAQAIKTFLLRLTA